MKWLHAKTDPTGNSSQYVYKTLNPPNGFTKVYVSIDACKVSYSTAEWFNIFDVYGVSGHSYPLDPHSNNPDDGGGIWAAGTPLGAGPLDPNHDFMIDQPPNTIYDVLPDTGPVNIKMMIDISTNPETWIYKIDEETYDLTNQHGAWHGWFSQFDFLIVGGSFGGDNSENYITNVKAGTTDWDTTDILSDDFSTGDFSKWDGVIDGASVGGLLEIVDTSPCSAPISPVMRNVIKLS